MKKLSLFLILITFSILIIYSCRREFKAPEWQTSLLTPVLSAKLSWSNLLSDTNLAKNSDNSLNFIYRKNILDFSTDTMLKIKDVSIDTIYMFPGFYINLSPGETYIDYKQDTKLDIKDLELREVKLKSGFLTIKVKSYISEKVKARFQLPKTILNHRPFDTTMIVPKRVTPEQGGEIVGRFDLKGYTIDLTGKKGNIFNTLIFGLMASIDTSAKGAVKIYNKDTLLFSCTFDHIVPEYGLGYLGQSSFSINSKIPDFTFVKNVSGNVILDSVKLLLDVENGVGADARVKINELTSLNSSTGNTVLLTGNIMNQSLNVSRALWKYPSFIPSKQTFTINSGNSNINQFIENLPDQLSYSITAGFNPLGDISGGNDFLFETSKLKISAYLQIPLRFSTQNLTLTKDIDYSITSADPNITKGNLYLYANNGFPFSATLQLYLLNDNGTVIDSLISSPNTIQGAPIDGSKRVSQRKSTQLIIPVNEVKLKLLYERKKVKAKLKLNTANYPSPILMYDNYDMDLRLVGDFTYNINLK